MTKKELAEMITNVVVSQLSESPEFPKPAYNPMIRSLADELSSCKRLELQSPMTKNDQIISFVFQGKLYHVTHA